jgi:hypothetical protein
LKIQEIFVSISLLILYYDFILHYILFSIEIELYVSPFTLLNLSHPILDLKFFNKHVIFSLRRFNMDFNVNFNILTVYIKIIPV